jgi:hypothetical protein
MPNYWKSGMRITAARINRTLPIPARKLVASTRVATTTEVADSELVIPLLANTNYLVEGSLLTSGPDAGGDFKYGWEWTGTMTVIMGGIGGVNTIASGSSGSGEFAWAAVDTSSPSASISFATSVTGLNAQVKAWVEVGATEGNLSLRWAQLSASGTTTLNVGSWLLATPHGFN